MIGRKSSRTGMRQKSATHLSGVLRVAAYSGVMEGMEEERCEGDVIFVVLIWRV